ncbi:MAG: DUF2959 domain-containing protein [Phycisphaeraceae bacterium]|nr:DUF2959 domain-containing protein [Phycisphaeraceae bacterium]
MIRSLVGGAAIVAVGVSCVAGGCSSTTIAIKEKMGIPKREQLVARVNDARDGQQEAKQQFASALHEFMAVTGASGGDLEAKYDKLRKEYERSESRAETVHSRIKDVERVAEALFKEWKAELAQYSSESMRQASQRELEATRARYDGLIGAMRAAAAKMQPVLAAFKDQVLFLKHNLNARAIASLQGNVAQIQTDVGNLIRDMESSIAEANAFIDQMQKGEAK